MPEVREHRTNGKLNRQRVQLELTRAVRSGLVVVASLVIAVVIALKIAHNIGSSIGQSSQTVAFQVNDATDVVAQSDEVRYLGIPAGRVASVKMKGEQPIITGTFSTKYGKIYKNARAVIRPNTALEDMSVDVVYPGTPSAGLATANDPLPAAATDTSVNLDDVLDTFNADARTSLETTLNNLGNGLKDRGAALKEAFVELVPTIHAAANLTSQLAQHGTYVEDLVHNTSTLMADLSQRQTELRTLISQGSSALTTLSADGGNLGSTLHELPGTLVDLRSSLNTVSGVLGKVDTAVRSLYPVANDLPSSLSSIRSLSSTASPAVRALQKPVTQLVPTVQTLVPLSQNLSAAVNSLVPQEGTIEHVVKDLHDCRTGVQGFFEWNPSLAKYGDARGQGPRGNAVIRLQSSGTLNSPFESQTPGCTPGPVAGGGVPTSADEH